MRFWVLLTVVVLTLTTCEAKRSRRPVTKPRNQIVVPPVSCPDLYEATINSGDDGPLIRKTQHDSSCKKYFECATNTWLIRDCPEGTTFNLEDKGCDLLKACKPSQVKDLYEQGVEELKTYLGLGGSKEI